MRVGKLASKCCLYCVIIADVSVSILLRVLGPVLVVAANGQIADHRVFGHGEAPAAGALLVGDVAEAGRQLVKVTHARSAWTTRSNRCTRVSSWCSAVLWPRASSARTRTCSCIRA